MGAVLAAVPAVTSAWSARISRSNASICSAGLSDAVAATSELLLVRRGGGSGGSDGKAEGAEAELRSEDETFLVVVVAAERESESPPPTVALSTLNDDGGGCGGDGGPDDDDTGIVARELFAPSLGLPATPATDLKLLRMSARDEDKDAVEGEEGRPRAVESATENTGGGGARLWLRVLELVPLPLESTLRALL